MNKLLLISGIIFPVFGLKAQEDYGKYNTTPLVVQEQAKSDVKSLWKELKGTFQIVYSGDAPKILLTDELLLTIKSARQESEDFWLDIQENVKVFIPSKNQIESTTFEPLLIEKNLN